MAPIIVVGLPRSGTTHLVNLIAADPRLRSLPLWESYEPVPTPGEPATRDAADPRHQRCAGGLGGHAADRPLPGRDAPDGARPRPRGAGAAAPGLHQLRAGVGGPGPRVAGPLPGHRPDPALRVPAHRPEDPAVVLARRALGPEVAPAPGAARSSARHLPRCHRRRHPPGSRVGHPVGGHDADLRSPHELPHDGARVVPGLLGRPDRAPAVGLGARPAPGPRRSVGRRPLPRVHGRRRRHRRAHLRGRRPDHDRRAPGPRSTGYRAGHERGRDGQVVYDVRRDFGAEPEALRAPFAFYFDRFAVQEEVR